MLTGYYLTKANKFIQGHYCVAHNQANLALTRKIVNGNSRIYLNERLQPRNVNLTWNEK